MSYATKIACYEAAVGTILISIKPIARNYDTYEPPVGTILISIEPFAKNYDTYEAAIGPIYASEEPFAISKRCFFRQKNARRMQNFEQNP